MNFQNTGDIEMSVYLSDTGITIIIAIITSIIIIINNISIIITTIVIIVSRRAGGRSITKIRYFWEDSKLLVIFFITTFVLYCSLITSL